ncbi:MAG: NAD-binding protein [Candidatus Pelethousia sp.]|nr:NAD-binding protein [Candidatus Pelethousia sp.]
MTMLLIATVGVVLLGYAIMHRIDTFIRNGSEVHSPQGHANRGILVYGAPTVASKIQKAGGACSVLAELSFPQDGFYSAFFALSEDDDKNLILCHAAKQADPGIYIIVRCNTPAMRELFEMAGASRLIDADESLDPVFAELWGVGI